MQSAQEFAFVTCTAWCGVAIDKGLQALSRTVADGAHVAGGDSKPPCDVIIGTLLDVAHDDDLAGALAEEADGIEHVLEFFLRDVVGGC